MKQEDKELLIKDLCCRLPYKVKLETLEGPQELDIRWLSINMCNIANPYLPYLYPLSSMTEEQRKEFLNIQSEERKILTDALVKYRYEKEDNIPIIPFQKHIDWLNKNHFDYRGLIEKGLAIDATGKNIY